ncbi:MAG: hypothetical protein BRD53_06865 [Bacteroidetes bacterium SW_7_64_58]|nr:MAG: hypothetical protein BRD53_06865 [Bacteroidetes bacterium SW_7_64_58]
MCCSLAEIERTDVRADPAPDTFGAASLFEPLLTSQFVSEHSAPAQDAPTHRTAMPCGRSLHDGGPPSWW